MLTKTALSWILVLVLAGISVMTSAGKAAAATRIGVEAGLNEALLTFHNSQGFFDYEPDYHPAWSGGVVVEPELGRRVRIQTGLRYIEYGDVESFTVYFTEYPPGTTSTFPFRYHWTLRYLDLPVRLSLRPPVSRRITFELGPEIRWLAQALERHDFFGFEEGVLVTDGTSEFRRWTTALSGGVGWEIPIAEHTCILKMRYVHGLMNELRGSVERKTRGVELTAGMFW